MDLLLKSTLDIFGDFVANDVDCWLDGVVADCEEGNAKTHEHNKGEDTLTDVHGKEESFEVG